MPSGKAGSGMQAVKRQWRRPGGKAVAVGDDEDAAVVVGAVGELAADGGGREDAVALGGGELDAEVVVGEGYRAAGHVGEREMDFEVGFVVYLHNGGD